MEKIAEYVPNKVISKPLSLIIFSSFLVLYLIPYLARTSQGVKSWVLFVLHSLFLVTIPFFGIFFYF